jgi:hypothetical protein
VIIRNGLISNTGTAYSFDDLANLDTCIADNLFRQHGSTKCLDYCPTGSEKLFFPRVCSEGPDIELSTAVFTLITEFPMKFFEGQISKGRYLGGAIDLGLDLVRGIDDPIFLPFRGMYFDGHNDFMRLVDFIFSGDASISVVLRKPTIAVGTLFSLDTGAADDAELAISFEGAG